MSVLWHFTIDIEMCEADYKQMVNEEWASEDEGDHCPVYVAAKAFTHAWFDKYGVEMDITGVGSTGDVKNIVNWDEEDDLS